MFNIINKTPYIAEAVVIQDKDGERYAVTVVKASYRFDLKDRVVLAPEQVPIIAGDQYWGEPGRSSIKYASDMVLEKDGTDIALIGHAYAPHNKKAAEVDVELRVGSIKKRIRVFGDRYWRYYFGIVVKTDPIPFNKMPLIYERAFGGEDKTAKKEKRHGFCERNPVGRGFRINKARESLNGYPLPNLEDVKNCVKSWKHKPEPAGFGFIAPSWLPRSSYSGTYDDNWKKNKMPMLPDDFDKRFNNSANPDLISKGFIKGDEVISLINVHPIRDIRFRLPDIRIDTKYIIGNLLHNPDVYLDTLTIEPDDNRFTLVWRSKVKCQNKVSQVREINITHKNGE